MRTPRTNPLFAHVLALATLGSSASACGASLPRPPRGAHVSADFTEVAERPPPPRVEDVLAPPDARAAWIDGEWTWSGRKWTWRSGGWVIVPPGAAFAPWDVYVDADGRVLMAPGVWRNARGEVVESPAVLGGKHRARDAAQDAGVSDARVGDAS